MNETEWELQRLTGTVLSCAFRVSNTLGSGFLEKVYENALAMELREKGMRVLQQANVDVLYRDRVVGQYVSDLIVDQSVVVEVKATSSLQSSHEAQCMNYLKATRLKVCLLLNFGRPKIEYRRIIWSRC
jgi:GxxExxY protein